MSILNKIKRQELLGILDLILDNLSKDERGLRYNLYVKLVGRDPVSEYLKASLALKIRYWESGTDEQTKAYIEESWKDIITESSRIITKELKIDE